MCPQPCAYMDCAAIRCLTEKLFFFLCLRPIWCPRFREGSSSLAPSFGRPHVEVYSASSFPFYITHQYFAAPPQTALSPHHPTISLPDDDERGRELAVVWGYSKNLIPAVESYEEGVKYEVCVSVRAALPSGTLTQGSDREQGRRVWVGVLGARCCSVREKEGHSTEICG